MNKLRVALVGVGGMAGHHAKLFHEHPKSEVKYICDLKSDLAQKLANQFNANAYRDYQDILDKNDYDAVLIGVPNTLHYPIALDFLKAGKHTAVEYPICQTLKEFNLLAETADKNNVILHDVLTPVIEPQALYVKDNLNKIGKVISSRSAYYAGGSKSWYVQPKIRGNFYSALTIHQIVYFNVILDHSPVWVNGAINWIDLGEGAAATTGSFICQYEDGIIAINDWGMGFDKSPTVWEWIIEGSEGRIIYECPSRQPHQIRIKRKKIDDEVIVMPAMEEVHPEAINAFVQQVLNDQPPYSSRNFSRKIIQICELAQQSTDQGKRIMIK